MKTFEQLTPKQAIKAHEIAYQRLQESIAIGLIVVPDGTNEHDMALEAAQGSQYEDDGRPIMKPIDVPFYFQGGCV